MFRPICEPRTRAREYSDLAINIYTGCTHECWYCCVKRYHDRFNPTENFTDVRVRDGIVESVTRHLSGGSYIGKKIMLCYACDPYPSSVDTMPTRDVIKAIKDCGAHVQLLTKGGDRARRDFDLLDKNDSFGITITGEDEPLAAPELERIHTLRDVAKIGVSTWVSLEPVINPMRVWDSISVIPEIVSKDTLLRIGMLNHYKSKTNWKQFGIEAERICNEKGWRYYIKEDLRLEMG